MPKILLVDDEELVVRSIEKLLKKEGYEVVSVKNGYEAVKKAEKEDFDLLVTDIRMPSLNGIETIRQIRESRSKGGLEKIPEICITGFADNELYQQAEQLGVAGYLYKPFDLHDFLSCVKKHIKIAS